MGNTIPLESGPELYKEASNLAEHAPLVMLPSRLFHGFCCTFLSVNSRINSNASTGTFRFLSSALISLNDRLEV